MSKDLRDKAIDIKGKQYVLVSDRIIYFNETYPEGCIFTELVSEPSDQVVVVKAYVFPKGQHEYKDDINVMNILNSMSNGTRVFTGYSQAKWGDGYINKTSALENCETSAVGRALAMMGIGVIDSVASVDEINKANTYPKKIPETPKYDNLKLKKNEVFKQLQAHDVPLEDRPAYIESVIGKKEISTVEEADKILDHLELKADVDAAMEEE